MQLALIGVPGSGVKTVFSAMTGHVGSAGAFSSAPGQPRLAVVPVPDERLGLVSQVFQPQKTTHATVELIEYPGLLGGKSVDPRAVGKAREADALVLVLRTFASPVSPHPAGSVDPQRDLARLESEMILADLTVVETPIQRIEKLLKRQKNDEDLAELDVLLRCRQVLEAGQAVRTAQLSPDERKRIRCYRFFTEKPRLLILNIGEDQLGQEAALVQPFRDAGIEAEALCGSLEAELAQLEEKEQAEFMRDFGVRELAAPMVLSAAFRVLEVVTFYTYGPKECRAWNVRMGDTAVDAAARVHTDLAQGFVRAEVFAFQDFKEHRDVKGVKAAGKFRLEGRDYVVQDGDIIIIRHNA